MTIPNTRAPEAIEIRDTLALTNPIIPKENKPPKINGSIK